MPRKQKIQQKTTFLSAIKSYWMGFFNFAGVATRPEFWWAFLFVMLVSIAADLFGGTLVSLILTVIFFFPSMSIAFRRYHDAGFSGWLYLGPRLLFMFWLAFRYQTWLFMLNLEWMTTDLKIFIGLIFVWVIFNFIVLVQPSKLKSNKYRK